jgi:hypothetical protein
MEGRASCREARCDYCAVGIAEGSDANVVGQADRKGLTGFADAVKNIDLDAVEFVETEFGSRKAVVNKKVAHEWQQFVEVGLLTSHDRTSHKGGFLFRLGVSDCAMDFEQSFRFRYGVQFDCFPARSEPSARLDSRLSSTLLGAARHLTRIPLSVRRPSALGGRQGRPSGCAAVHHAAG